ncbi:hypothetical protein [Kineosporia sp. NBRC 101731]|uniref:hypothetical protein n=1 Tax=Kineosporia sp. NBRC 101731 TaxID=3032199 RepID=UPI0024A01590|nr:hypothetical protein [Kineosporia sp. NBRC 101731]GLY27837.1 hypothetical protein Kisp02_12020 [Kineosporia sp. NBRC 101731]
MSRIQNPDEDVRTFLDYAGRIINVNVLGRDWEDDFVNAISGMQIDSLKESFRRGFAKSLTGKLTPAEYEHHTDWYFDDDAEFHSHLALLWQKFYGDADPRDSLAG